MSVAPKIAAVVVGQAALNISDLPQRKWYKYKDRWIVTQIATSAVVGW